MLKGFIGKDYRTLVLACVAIAVVLLLCTVFLKSLDAVAWVQAMAVVVALVLAIAVPAIERQQAAQLSHKRWRERQVAYARRMQYFVLEFQEQLAHIGNQLVHLRAADRHRLMQGQQDYLHRLFESHKRDLNEDRVVIAHELRQLAMALVDELESGRSDRAVLQMLEKRLQKLTQRAQANAHQAERA